MRRRDFLTTCSGYLVTLAATGETACARKPPERCIHWYALEGKLPAVLLAGKLTDPSDVFYSQSDRGNFSVGLPELLIFTSGSALRPRFPKYYPFTPEQLSQLRGGISVITDVAKLAERGAVQRAFEAVDAARLARVANTGAIVTCHKNNLFLVPTIIEFARQRRLSELCIIKDPTVPPYLCDVKAWG